MKFEINIPIVDIFVNPNEKIYHTINSDDLYKKAAKLLLYNILCMKDESNYSSFDYKIYDIDVVDLHENINILNAQELFIYKLGEFANNMTISEKKNIKYFNELIRTSCSEIELFNNLIQPISIGSESFYNLLRHIESTDRVRIINNDFNKILKIKIDDNDEIINNGSAIALHSDLFTLNSFYAISSKIHHIIKKLQTLVLYIFSESTEIHLNSYGFLSPRGLFLSTYNSIYSFSLDQRMFYSEDKNEYINIMENINSIYTEYYDKLTENIKLYFKFDINLIKNKINSLNTI